MPETIPSIDFTKIEFPSDKITIKMIRSVYPKATDISVELNDVSGISLDRVYNRNLLDEFIGVCLIDNEREIAERAFRVSLNQEINNIHNNRPPNQYSRLIRNLSDRSDLIDCLTDVYIKFGLARGEHDAAVLIQRIEKQAEAQARQFSGHRR